MLIDVRTYTCKPGLEADMAVAHLKRWVSRRRPSILANHSPT